MLAPQALQQVKGVVSCQKVGDEETWAYARRFWTQGFRPQGSNLIKHMFDLFAEPVHGHFNLQKGAKRKELWDALLSVSIFLTGHQASKTMQGHRNFYMHVHGVFTM